MLARERTLLLLPRQPTDDRLPGNMNYWGFLVTPYVMKRYTLNVDVNNYLVLNNTKQHPCVHSRAYVCLVQVTATEQIGCLLHVSAPTL